MHCDLEFTVSRPYLEQLYIWLETFELSGPDIKQSCTASSLVKPCNVHLSPCVYRAGQRIQQASGCVDDKWDFTDVKNTCGCSNSSHMHINVCKEHTNAPLSFRPFSSMVICSASSDKDSSIVWLPRRVWERRRLNRFIFSMELSGRGGLRTTDKRIHIWVVVF